MWGVIWGHTITALRAGQGQPVWILTFFRTYDMPLFMLLSGYFLAKSMSHKSAVEVALDRIGMILIPLFFWEIIIGLTGPLFVSVKNLFSLWFLWSLVGCTGISIVIFGVVKSKKLAVCLMAAVIVLIHCLNFIPFNIGYMLPFFTLGYCIQLIGDIDGIRSFKFRGFAVIAFVVMQCFWSGQYNVWNAGTYILDNLGKTLPIILFRGCIGIFGCLVMPVLFDILYDKLIHTRWKTFFVSAGKETLLLYILQSVVIEKGLSKLCLLLTNFLGWNPLTANMRFLGYVMAPAIALTCIFALLGCICILHKIPCRYNCLTGFRLSKHKR